MRYLIQETSPAGRYVTEDKATGAVNFADRAGNATVFHDREHANDIISRLPGAFHCWTIEVL